MKNELQQLLPASSAPMISGARQCAVVLPVSEPCESLDACLLSLVASSRRLLLDGTPTAIYVILAGHDAQSAEIASHHPVHVITADQTDAAGMRSIGARAALNAGASWLAFTEPSAVVSETWLGDQLECGSDLVLGSVEVTDLFLSIDRHADSSIEFFHDEDNLDLANFGLNARALGIYQHVAERDGGIDRTLARRLKGLGILIARCDKPLVYRKLQHCPDILETLPDFTCAPKNFTARLPALV